MHLSRRRFVKIATGGLAASALPPFSFLPKGPWRADFQLLRRNVGIFTERGGTIGWLVQGEGILVVDSQYPDTAELFLEGLPGREGRSVDVLINSHHHADHTGGNGTLRDRTRQIVAHRRARELHRDTGPEGVEAGLADETFSDEWSVEIGDERIRARHHGPAHTGGDSTIHFERANIVHMGDLVFNRAYPFIDRPGGASVRGWVQLLDAVEAEHESDTIFIFGHGSEGFGVTGDRSDLRVQADFLRALLDEAARGIREGRSREEMLEAEAIPGFPDHRPLGGRLTAGAALATAYDELRGGDEAAP